jgi:outer membrane protein OmpA-like peptidoglycan-associated protein
METAYFEFNKYSLQTNQIQNILNFAGQVDTTAIESIQIYGYCDDRGSNDYNFKLSQNRVKTVQNILIEKGFNKNRMVIIEGKGRVLLSKDTVKDLNQTRSKNRRVDILLVKKNSFKNGMYNSFHETHTVGDRIYLNNILFTLGSSKLTEQSKKELDKIVLLLQKNKRINFEIQGHVCCTPNYYNDGIDRETKERKLSFNRAKTVFRYLISKGVNSLRMTYKGYGNRKPLGKGEVLDRRVELVITKI